MVAHMETSRLIRTLGGLPIRKLTTVRIKSCPKMLLYIKSTVNWYNV